MGKFPVFMSADILIFGGPGCKAGVEDESGKM